MHKHSVKTFFFGCGPPSTPRPYQRTPENHTYAQYFQEKPMQMDRYQSLKLVYSDRLHPPPIMGGITGGI